MATTPNYEINYEDERFTQVESDKNQAMNDLDQTYAGMIGSTDKYYDEQIQATKDWADKQTQIQQDNTDFAIEQVEQQKDQAHKDYLKEQSGAYVDWQNQSNQYGVEAEKMASAGLANTGYSESSQVSMYNTYQNRVATARESYNRAVLNYNNAIKDAQLQNNAALAEIAYNALQQQLELSLQGFQYKNQLILEQANKKTELDNMYYNRYQDVLQQINTENAMAEDIRQYNETMKWNTEQKELDRQHDKDMAQINYDYQVALEGVKHDYDKKLAKIEQDYKIAYLDAETQAQKDLLDKELEIAKEKLKAEREEQEKLLKYEYDLKKQSIGTVSGSGDGTTTKTTTNKDVMDLIKKNAGFTGNSAGGTTTNTKQYPVNMQSVADLGYGPISATTLAKLVAEGKVTSYVKNGQTYYKNARPTLPTEGLYYTNTKNGNFTKLMRK